MRLCLTTSLRVFISVWVNETHLQNSMYVVVVTAECRRTAMQQYYPSYILSEPP